MNLKLRTATLGLMPSKTHIKPRLLSSHFKHCNKPGTSDQTQHRRFQKPSVYWQHSHSISASSLQLKKWFEKHRFNFSVDVNTGSQTPGLQPWQHHHGYWLPSASISINVPNDFKSWILTGRTASVDDDKVCGFRSDYLKIAHKTDRKRRTVNTEKEH